MLICNYKGNRMFDYQFFLKAINNRYMCIKKMINKWYTSASIRERNIIIKQ